MIKMKKIKYIINLKKIMNKIFLRVPLLKIHPDIILAASLILSVFLLFIIKFYIKSLY